MRVHSRIIRPQPDIFAQIGIKNVFVKEIIFYEPEKKIDFFCYITSAKYLDELDTIYEKIKNKFNKTLEVNFKVDLKDKALDDSDIKDIAERSIKRLKAHNAISKSFLYLYRMHISTTNTSQVINIELNNDMAIDTLRNQKTNIKLEKIMKDYGLSSPVVDFILGDFSKETSEILTLNQNELLALSKKMDKENSKIKPIEPARSEDTSKGGKVFFNNSNNNRSWPSPRNNANKTREIKGSSISVSDFYSLDENSPCVVQGEVFFVDIRELKNDKRLLMIMLTDGTDSMSAKIFLDKNFKLDIEKGKYLKISGKKQIDTFNNNEPVLMISSINFIEKEAQDKKDTSEKKMVELHTHSKMSEMCGVATTTDLINRAVSYGHQAMAITDYAVVHSFPEAFKAASKTKGFKAILGCEMYMIDDVRDLVHDPKDISLDDETYVVFDIETMGLNSHDNAIIEIGAIKMKGTRIIDKFSQLIDPQKPIPTKISKLTHITDQMLKEQPTIKEVLPLFMDFVGNATMVAHNAMFDMGFIKRDAKQIMGIDYDPTVMDTLTLAKVIFPEMKSYGLDALNKKLGLSLENHHRAVDDAQATANMFAIFLEKYKEVGAKTQKDINSALPQNPSKQESFNIVVLAKDHTGLKNLYKLVSMAHIDYFGNKRPKIPRSVLLSHREGLLIGCSMTGHFMNFSELFYYYMRSDYQKIDQNIDFYDYIELLPKAAYSELVDEDGSGEISSFDSIEKMNKFFYEKAQKRNIIVTASSDVHYLDEDDSVIRSILLNGSGNVHNPKFYNTDNKLYFRTTAELLSEFSYMGDDIAKEIVITNTNKIADMAENDLNPIPTGFYPPKIDNADKIIKDMTYEKAHRIYGDPLPDIVEKRLKRELDAIINHGFSVLYLSAQKLVKKSLDGGYLVGSRGSVGSSLVAFMMGITEVNALYPHYICDDPNCKYSEFIEKEGIGVDLPDKLCPKCGKPLRKDGFTIPFEVFMGFDGDKTPDIDLNFSGEYQSEIHRYTETLFGKENVFKAGTISTLAERNAYGYVKKYFEDSMKYNEDHIISSLPNTMPNTAEITRLAQKVEGAKKTTGQHPGGMVVVPSDHSIYEFCPVQKPGNDQTNDSTITHFDYHVMDEQLVKLDILGHDDPTTIKLLQEYTGIDIYKVPLADKDTLKLFSSTESLGVTPEEIGSVVGTYGVPEFGTHFVRKVLVETKPTTFAELVRISGLSHGTDVWTNNAEELVNAGKATLSDIITVRDDIMNYLIDQGMEKLTSFKIMEFVRKGKAKQGEDPNNKFHEDWEKFKAQMKEKNIAKWYIDSCSKIGYMFPKGHAAAYVMMAMRIAYFKVHYPLAFYAAYFSRKAEDFDYDLMKDITSVKKRLEEYKKEPPKDVKKKIEQTLCEILVEMHARKIEFLPIDIYVSDGFRFTVENGKIRIPLIGLNGLGASAIENVIRERSQGEFLSFEDLKKRSKMSNTILDKLKEIGAVSSLNETNQKSLF